MGQGLGLRLGLGLGLAGVRIRDRVSYGFIECAAQFDSHNTPNMSIYMYINIIMPLPPSYRFTEIAAYHNNHISAAKQLNGKVGYLHEHARTIALFPVPDSMVSRRKVTGLGI